MERSFSRCVKANYLAQKVPLSDARIAHAWSNDLDEYSGSLTIEDIRRAPQDSIDGMPFIRCSWFSERTLPR